MINDKNYRLLMDLLGKTFSGAPKSGDPDTATEAMENGAPDESSEMGASKPKGKTITIVSVSAHDTKHTKIPKAVGKKSPSKIGSEKVGSTKE